MVVFCLQLASSFFAVFVSELMSVKEMSNSGGPFVFEVPEKMGRFKRKTLV